MRTTADINKLTVLFDRGQASVMNLIDLVLLQAIKEDGGNFQALDRQQLRHVSRVRKTTRPQFSSL
jgi:hypothetical protein